MIVAVFASQPSVISWTEICSPFWARREKSFGMIKTARTFALTIASSAFSRLPTVPSTYAALLFGGVSWSMLSSRLSVHERLVRRAGSCRQLPDGPSAHGDPRNVDARSRGVATTGVRNDACRAGRERVEPPQPWSPAFSGNR